MSEQDDNEVQETLTPDEGQAQDPELDIEALKEKAAKAEEYKGFAERVSNENKELKKKLQPQDSLPTNKETSSVSKDDFQRLELKTDGFKGEEIDFIMRNGGAAAVNDPLVKAAIESLRKSKKSQDATPSGTGKSPVYQKFTEGDLKKMSAEDLEKIIPQ